MLAVLGVGGQTAMPSILVGLTIRALALTLIAASLLAMQRYAADDGFAQVTGLARRLPVATLSLLVGGLTLVGIPLTVGFPLRWQLFQTITQANYRWPVLLILAGIGVSIGYLRGLRALLSFKKEERLSQADRITLSLQESRWLLIIISILVVICIILGIFPSLLTEPLQQLSIGLSVPIR